MTCHEARDLFSALVDETALAEERARAEAHLAGCPECRRELQRFGHTVGLLRSLEPARAPAGFAERVAAAARPAPRLRLLAAAFRPLPLKLPLQAAAVVMVGVLVAYVFRQAPELQQAVRYETPLPSVSKVSPPEPAAPPPAAVPTPAPVPSAVSAPTLAPPVAPAPSVEPRPATKAAERAETDEARRILPAVPPRIGAPEGESRLPESAGPTCPTEAVPAPGLKADAMGRGLAPGREQRATAPESGEQRAALEEKVLERRAEEEPAPAKLQARAAAPGRADVYGTLTVADRAGARRRLEEVVARLGGFVAWRRSDQAAAVVQIRLPRSAFPELARELRALGQWTPGPEPAELPAEVKFDLTITD